MTRKEIKAFLDAESARRNCSDELCLERPDPLLVARRCPEEHFALTCALFAYGNAKAIVSFLSTLPPNLIDADEDALREALAGVYYRFQNTEDIVQWHITLGRLKEGGGVESAFMKGYHSGDLLSGTAAVIEELYRLNPYRSRGYEFLIGKPVSTPAKASAMKRWMMYLRWMVRSDALDLGLWRGVDASELVMPLDTHTFEVSRRFGLLRRSQCDFKAALELTQTLKTFDASDPVRYDFALYRLGQEKIL